MKTHTQSFLIALLGLILILAGCNKDSDTPNPSGGYSFTAKYAVDGGTAMDFSGQNVPGGQSATLAKYEAGKERSMGISGASGGVQFSISIVDVGENVNLKSYAFTDITQGITPEATASLSLPGTGNFIAISGQITLTRFNKTGETSAEIDGTFSFSGKDLTNNKSVSVSSGEFKNVGVKIAN